MKKLLIPSLVSLSFQAFSTPIDDLWLKAEQASLSDSEYKQLVKILKTEKSSDAPLMLTKPLDKGINLVSNQVTFTQCQETSFAHRTYPRHQSLDIEVFDRSDLIKFFERSRKTAATMAGFDEGVMFADEMASALPTEHTGKAYYVGLSFNKIIGKYTANTSVYPDLIAGAQRLLDANTEQSLNSFRDICGDAYVSEVIVGQGLQAVIRVSTDSGNPAWLSSVSTSIKELFQTVTSGSSPAEIKKQKQQLLQHLSNVNLSFSFKKTGSNAIEDRLTLTIYQQN